MSDIPTDQPRGSIYYLAIICVTTLVAFGGLFSAEFTFLDDPLTLWQNSRLNPPTLGGVAYYWAHSEYGLYVPVTYTAWSGLARIGYIEQADPMGSHLNPAVFHAANLLLHVIAALVVFALLRRLMNDPRAACIGAMLFALHPVQVEAVGWASGLKDVLAGALGLIAIWQYVAFAQEPKKRHRYVIAMIAFVAAMLSKPSALVVPFIVGAIDLWLLNRPRGVVLKSIGPWIILSVLCAIVGRIAQPAVDVANAPLWARPFLAGEALAFYLCKLIWPFNLSFDYGLLPLVEMHRWWVYLCWLIPAAIVGAAWMSRLKRPQIWAGTLIFILALAPVLGLVTFLFQRYSTTADHYLYIAMLGPALILAQIIHKSRGRVALIAASCGLGLLSIRTIFQARVWQDDIPLFSHMLAVNPNSTMAVNGLGNFYLNHRAYDQAEEYFHTAVQMAPDDPAYMENLALVLEEENQPEGAISYRRRALQIRLRTRPHTANELLGSYMQLVNDLMDTHQWDQASDAVSEALKLDPQNSEVHKTVKVIQQHLQPSTTQATQSSSTPGSGG